ncbi:inositol phosphorylceramide synthase [Saccharomonospora piscinae]|uniref:Inositol phosphorylceramide synthase n=1 Tax=Saccharomonospora piscinae TaxID=687388 RepID=A0A1V9A9J7_SACPI|nr:phosphatase PAP2 family protein [Saccharomonospora piscinae]OQO93738.1 inositol phosphorylceramide synthase [Saccharomonospora piscinae]TLW94901.1 inositol phosphorylceramide synthase [Saccharomonospora piscinae]
MLTAGSVTSTTPRPAARRPLRRPRWWREIALGLALFGVYSVLGGLAMPGHERRAFANGEDILALERLLHTDVELVVNHWLAGQGWLTVAANYEYAFSYVAVTLVTLAWLYRRRPERYRWARDAFVVANVLAILCFWAYPVAPPRLLPDAGFVDTVRLGGTWGSWGSPMVDGANQLAAMPSLHIGWALWASLALSRARAPRWAQTASALHVLLTLVVIVATGNHYWLDAVGGVAVVWLGALAADLARGSPVTWTASARQGLWPPLRRPYTVAVTDTAAETSSPPAVTSAQRSAVRTFAAEHGTPVKAVVQRIGRAGARVVLVGDDGAMGDVVVPDVATGEALIAAVADVEAAEWDAETVGATAIGARHRRRMAGPLARR